MNVPTKVRLRGQLMNARWVLAITTAMLAVTGLQRSARAQTVTACANASSCVQVKVTPSSANANVGDTVPVTLSFQQAPSNGQSGGPDEIAALALTLSIAKDGSGQPLELSDCTQTGDGLPAAVVPDASISNFKVVVENAFCDSGRTHCLCPGTGSGTTPDNFVNLVVYGPNPLPAPGTPVDIPTLPAGPQNLATVNLKVRQGASGNIPLHVYTETVNNQKPQFTAFLSVGDKLAVDQTCVPVTGQPPCSSGSTSQVAITDGAIQVGGGGCVCPGGDCDNSGSVAIDDIIVMVNAALGAGDTSTCPCGDADHSNTIDITDIITAVTNAQNSTCSAG
jgi:hypothetical protein